MSGAHMYQIPPRGRVLPRPLEAFACVELNHNELVLRSPT